LRHFIEQQPGWTVCGEARDGRQAVEMAERLTPDIAVLDITMPELNGLEATRQIRRVSPGTEVLVFTIHHSEDLVREVLAAGAKGFMLKSDAGRLIVAALEALAAHKPFFNREASETLLDAFLRAAGGTGAKASTEVLSAREREVVQMIAEGRGNKEAAARLGVGVKTIEAHRAAVMRKLGARSVADLVRYAVRNRIIEP
jgi:DNA-binding NarL/FixJ family response regulator